MVKTVFLCKASRDSPHFAIVIDKIEKDF